MQQVRKFAIIIVVAILFAIFIFSVADAALPERTLPDSCDAQESRYSYPVAERTETCEDAAEPSQSDKDACAGTLEPRFNGQCVDRYVCNCWELEQENRDKDEVIIFWIAIVLGFAGVIGGILLPKAQELNEWIGAGFMIGGLITIFIGTARFWDNIDKIARPLVIAAELALVIYLSYRQFGTKNGRKKTRKK